MSWAHDILKKLTLIGKDLAGYSLDTVKMFYADALASGFGISLASQTAHADLGVLV